jgi:hypothetical protein
VTGLNPATVLSQPDSGGAGHAGHAGHAEQDRGRHLEGGVAEARMVPGQLPQRGNVHDEEEQRDEHRREHRRRIAGHGAQRSPGDGSQVATGACQPARNCATSGSADLTVGDCQVHVPGRAPISRPAMTLRRPGNGADSIARANASPCAVVTPGLKRIRRMWRSMPTTLMGQVRRLGIPAFRQVLARIDLVEAGLRAPARQPRMRLSTYMSGKVTQSAALMVGMRRVNAQAQATPE